MHNAFYRPPGSAMNQWLPFILFASVASITPGPTNLLILGSAARFGLSIALAIAIGASLGASIMLLVVGLGLGELLAHAPLLQTAMTWAGAAWISWMACKLMRTDAAGLDERVPADCIRLAAAREETSTLGAMFGTVALERVPAQQKVAV